jgi:hypothetical protein
MARISVATGGSQLPVMGAVSNPIMSTSIISPFKICR